MLRGFFLIYDGAIAAFSAAHDAAPDNVGHLNLRGIAYSNKGDDEHALADYEMCLKPAKPSSPSPTARRPAGRISTSWRRNSFFVIARSEATKQSILSLRGEMDCFVRSQ
jgi:hypothetical protein